MHVLTYCRYLSMQLAIYTWQYGKTNEYLHRTLRKEKLYAEILHGYLVSTSGVPPSFWSIGLPWPTAACRSTRRSAIGHLLMIYLTKFQIFFQNVLVCFLAWCIKEGFSHYFPIGQKNQLSWSRKSIRCGCSTCICLPTTVRIKGEIEWIAKRKRRDRVLKTSWTLQPV